jgi:hypothetical protein
MARLGILTWTTTESSQSFREFRKQASDVRDSGKQHVPQLERRKQSYEAFDGRAE